MLFWKRYTTVKPNYQYLFQSLFCWMLFWKINRHYFRYRLAIVSILILLDVVLEVYRYSLGSSSISSFNPYSVGCCSGRHNHGKKEKPLYGFQSLFCWMLFWKFEPDIIRDNHLVVSILILLDVVLEVLLAHWPCLSSKCFNPYSVGCCSGSHHIWLPESLRKLFQSLFCWMLFWKQNSTRDGLLSMIVSILILLDVVLEASRSII